MAPYSGSIRATVKELEPGRAVLELKDRRRVRNHLNSIHAIALANLGEMTSGLAVMSALPPGIRGIITGLSMEYFKKARGPLRAYSQCEAPVERALAEDIESPVVCHIRNAEGAEVARATVQWRLGPVPPQ
jgi:acyl-coenzyme A thioesterase PaaI-like protein